MPSPSIDRTDSYTAPQLSRRQWLAAFPGAVAIAAVRPAWAEGDAYGGAKKSKLHAEFPSQDPTKVRDLVAAAHTRIDRVRELVEASPALAKAAWDWGFGDWESGLGAASHMGRADIAKLLMTHGARPNLFTFAMLGHVEVVRQIVESMPGIQRTPGPHGITLLQHAKNRLRQKGMTREDKAAASATVAYLESLGDANVNATGLEVTEAQKQIYLGRYTFHSSDDGAFEVITNRGGQLSIKRGQRFGRVMNRVEEHAFAPAGAPDVRIRFRVENSRAVSLTIHDPVPLVTARRVD